jgi:hypothetical protein
MKLRGSGLILLILCALGGLVASFFTPAIAATLTLPSGTGQARTTVSTPAPTLAITVPAEPTNQATPLPAGVVILAHDTFQRSNQQFWGTSSGGQTWSSDASADPAFAIVNNAGQITGGADGGAMQAILNVNSNNADLLFSGEVNRFDANGDINLGSVLRWQDATTWYKLFINGTKLELLRSLHGVQHALAVQPFQATGGVNYSLRFRVQGSYLFGKAWPTSQAEPTNWTFMVIDTALTSGDSGVRAFLAPGAVIRVTSFLETNVPLSTD